MAALFAVAAFPLNSTAAEQLQTESPSTEGPITAHVPISRTTPEKKLSKAPKWPWVVAGGLAVALIAILAGGDDSDNKNTADGNVAFEW